MNLKELWIFESVFCFVFGGLQWTSHFSLCRAETESSLYADQMRRNDKSIRFPRKHPQLCDSGCPLMCTYTYIYVDPEAASFLLACLLICGRSCTRRILIELRRRYRSIALWQQCIKLRINKVKLHITLSPPAAVSPEEGNKTWKHVPFGGGL